MSVISHDHAARIITRLGDTRGAAETPVVVATSFDVAVKPEVDQYVAASGRALTALNVLHLARLGADQAVARLEPVYGTTRAIVLACVGDILVPDTLGTLPTLSDAKNGITTLLGIVNDRASERWAAAVVASSFATLAPAATSAIDAWVTARSAAEAAVNARAAALAALYPKVVAFKEIVRRAFGKASVHYRGLSLRATRATAPVTPPAPEPPVATLAKSNGASATSADASTH